MSHARYEELVVAHAVDGTLDASDARDLITHLTGCEPCRDLARDLSETATELAFATPAVSPPAGLEDRIVGAVRAASVQRLPRVGRLRRLGLVAAVAAMLALGSATAVLYSSRQDGRAHELRAERALDILDDPAARWARLASPDDGATALVAFDPAGHGVLVIDGLAATPDGKVHELWLIAGGVPRPIDVFAVEGDEGRTIVEFDAPQDRYEAAAITLERGPLGSPVPTGDMLLSGQIIDA